MSVKATTIVSIEPSSTAAVSSSSVSMGEESYHGRRNDVGREP
jgi:hypothetical protein